MLCMVTSGMSCMMTSGMSFLPLFFGNFQAFPNGAGNKPPEEDEQAVAPIDDADAFAMFQGIYNLACYRFGFHQHGVVCIAQEVSGYEAGTDVGKADGQLLDVCQLYEGLDVGVLETFGCRIGGGYADTLGAGNGTDDGDVSAVLAGGMFLEVIECPSDHAHKPLAVGAGSAYFYLGFKIRILRAYTAAMEIEIHATQFVHQRLQTGGSIRVCHIQRGVFDLSVRKFGLQ